jgi:hypothetical protein
MSPAHKVAYCTVIEVHVYGINSKICCEKTNSENRKAIGSVKKFNEFLRIRELKVREIHDLRCRAIKKQVKYVTSNNKI